jgi:hypothetical protein
VSSFLNLLEESEEFDDARLAKLEVAFFPLLGRHGRQPKILHKELGQNPAFFIEVLSFVFPGEGEEPRQASEADEARARLGHELLDSWRTLPGIQSDGSIDPSALADWVKRAREGAAERGLGPIGDDTIGHVLSCAPNGPDGAWPHPAVRDVIESVGSELLEAGIEVGLLSSRGVVARDPLGGGSHEHQLAEKLEGHAAKSRDGWPRTTAMLRRIASAYRTQAQYQDQRAERRQELGL